MTQTKHTAGPWEAASMRSHVLGHITNSRGVGFSLHGGTRPEVKRSLCQYLDRLEVDRANLLEALKGVLVSCCEREQDLDGEGIAKLNKARAAISKVEGAQS